MVDEYVTLEQQIQELWKSRGLEVTNIQFSTVKKNKKLLRWIIIAKKMEEKHG